MNREQRRALQKQERHLKVVEDKKHPSRILWVSNAPWASTGYGQQTAQATSRLKKDGHQVAIAANYGLEANSTVWNSSGGNIPVYPRGFDQWSNDVIPAHMHDWHLRDKDAPHALITLFDVWVFKGPRWADWNVASWVPIDHMPTPIEVEKWCNQDFVTPIAMSQFGKAMLDAAGIESHYVPHGIENIFDITPEVKIRDEEITSRQLMGLPEDAFVVGMNAANKGVAPNRKAFGENLLAFSMFAQKHKDAILYLHTDPTPSMGGISLTDLIKACGIPKEQVKFADTYVLRSGFNQELLAGIYTGMDVLLAVSMGEGFGIPTVEAQACGTPVIVSDFAASRELVGDGWLVGGQPWWDAMQKAWFHTPHVPEIVGALEQAYQRGRERSVKAATFAEDYRADKVYDKYWKPTLEAVLSTERAHQVGQLQKGKNEA